MLAEFVMFNGRTDVAFGRKRNVRFRDDGARKPTFSSRVMPTALRQKLGSVISYPNIAFQIALFTHVLGALVRLRITGYQIN